MPVISKSANSDTMKAYPITYPVSANEKTSAVLDYLNSHKDELPKLRRMKK